VRWAVFTAVLAAVALLTSAGVATAVVTANANGEIQMLSPWQKIKYNLANHAVEYWNFEYPEGAGTLHYTSTVTCSSIDKTTKEARFLFQIPEGHPGLSGLYVVAYTKIIDTPSKNFLYGHASTTDLATATAWCQTGAGFAPQMYQVKSGVLYVK
jgi:hypothetical protein